MIKRGKLEIIKDILSVIQKNHNSIRTTPLIRQSNLSTFRFREYFSELLQKGFVKESGLGSEKRIRITDKGFRFLEKYKTIISFIEEFEL
ncbi:MAG: winged helix-turn-helix domain-containing protein [Candidatus Pacearchaeota archaeon]